MGEAGVPAKVCIESFDGTASDDTSAGSSMTADSSKSDIDSDDTSSQAPFGLDTSLVVQLGDDGIPHYICWTNEASPRGPPTISPGSSDCDFAGASHSLPAYGDDGSLKAALPVGPVGMSAFEVPHRQAVRTKLSAKAESFIPSGASMAKPDGPLPFMPMAKVIEAWQRWESGPVPL